MVQGLLQHVEDEVQAVVVVGVVFALGEGQQAGVSRLPPCLLDLEV